MSIQMYQGPQMIDTQSEVSDMKLLGKSNIECNK